MTSDHMVMARAVARAALRGLVAATRRRRAREWHVADELWTRADLGTSSFEILVRPDRPHVDEAVLRAALRSSIDDVRTRSPELRVAVRRSLAVESAPDAALLAELGFTLVATFPGDARSPRAWPGEERWELL